MAAARVADGGGEVAAGEAVEDGAQVAGRGERLAVPRPRSWSRRGRGRRSGCARRPCPAGAPEPASASASGASSSGKASSTAAANMSPAMPPSGSRWMWAMPSGRHGPGRHRAPRARRRRAGRRAGPCSRRRRPRPSRSRSTPVSPACSPRQALAVEAHPADPHRLELHLGLPLVDLGVRLALDALPEPVGAERDEPALRLDIVRRAHALRAGAGDDQVAARLQDVDRADHALHGLVVGLVQRDSRRRW